MALATIRRFTDLDAEKLDASAQRFAARHGLHLDLDDDCLSPREALEQHFWYCGGGGSWPRMKELQRLWQACFCRALGVAPSASITIAHGYIGWSVD